MAKLLFLLTLFASSPMSEHDSIYNLWIHSDFKQYIDYQLFREAMTAYYRYGFSSDVLTIIDYTLPSTQKRFFVLNLRSGKLIFREYVAHGRNSGENYATSFSNEIGSLKSCLGVFRTGDTYIGKHGYSLKLIGLEKGKNDNAQKRHIVIHGANYVSEKFIRLYGRLGRSWGCPALPVDKAKPIIDYIKGGTCLYIRGIDKNK